MGLIKNVELAGLFGVNYVAKRAALSPWDIRRCIFNGLIPRPTRTFQGSIRHYWDTEDVKKIVNILKNNTIDAPSYDNLLNKNGLLRMVEVCRYVGMSRHTLEQAIMDGKIKGPSHKILGYKKSFYSQKEADHIKKISNTLRGQTTAEHFEKIRKTHRSISDLAKMCDVQPISIGYQMNKGRLPKPTHQINRGFYFTVDEAEKVKKLYLSLPDRRDRGATERRRDGYFSIAEAAKKCGVARASLQHQLNISKLPRPTHEIRLFSGKYYTSKEVNKLIEEYKKISPVVRERLK